MEEKLFHTDIAILKTPEPEVRFTSGKTIYVETLVSDRWVSRYWNAAGRINFPYQRWTEEAFQLEINDEFLLTGFKWVSASEEKKTSRGARHFVVELENKIHPINLKVHTLLDGTPVLTRWLEITNTADKPIALTAVGLDMPRVLQVYSGQSLALPPEIFVIGFGEGSDIGLGSGHLDTHLRSTFTLSTPWLLLGVAPSIEELTPQRQERYLHYANIYKQFIRPLFPTCKISCALCKLLEKV